MFHEREIKFTVPHREVFIDITSLAEIAGYRLCDRGFRHQADVCLDTPDLRLYYGKSVLRIRRWDNHAVVTFKSHGGVSNGIYHRIEIESPVDPSSIDTVSDLPPSCPALDAFRSEFGDVELSKSLTVVNDRHIFGLMLDGEAAYELVLDDVVFHGRRGTASVLELEVEAKTPDDSGLALIGAELADRFHLKPAGPSKYLLGMEMVGDV